MPRRIATIIISLLTTLLHLSSLISVTKGESTTQTFSTTTTIRRKAQPPSSSLTTAPRAGTEEEEEEEEESTIIRIRGGGGSNDMVDATTMDTIPSSMTTNMDPTTATTPNRRLPPIEFVFSDIDGTLVHQPPSSPTTSTTTTTEHVNTIHEDEENHVSTNVETLPKLLHLPPSSTGNRGVISAETLVLCRTIRQQHQTDTTIQQSHRTRLVLVSGMRTSTLWKRLPYLPKADAYASESGGRIFYPVPVSQTTDNHEHDNNNNNNNDDDEEEDGVVRPVEFYGAKEVDLHPFRLVEDMEWRRKLSQPNGAGTDGYRGDLIDSFISSTTKTNAKTTQTDGMDGSDATDRYTLPLNERSSALWDFANDLVKRGLVVDCDSYATCFRVDRRKQKKGKDEIDGIFRELISLDVKNLGLGRSVNLGCVDFYPVLSGKKNCCAYLAQTLSSSSSSYSSSEQQLSQTAVCLCDDDNDIEMALACRHAFLPTIASESMVKVSREYPDRVSVMMDDEKAKGEGTALLLSSTKATEDALRRVLEELGR